MKLIWFCFEALAVVAIVAVVVSVVRFFIKGGKSDEK